MYGPALSLVMCATSAVAQTAITRPDGGKLTSRFLETRGRESQMVSLHVKKGVTKLGGTALALAAKIEQSASVSGQQLELLNNLAN